MKKLVSSLIIVSCLFYVCCQSPQPKKEFVTNAFQSLESSVRVDYGFTTGSGFVVETGLHPEKKIRFYKIITCEHVVDNTYSTYPLSPIVIFTRGKEKIRLAGKVLKTDERLDLALIEVWQSDDKLRFLPFKITSQDDVVKYFAEVILVSYPQGLGPIATKGIISGLNVLPWAAESIVATSQSAPGSSGGALVAVETGEVVGVLKAVLRVSGGTGVLNWFSILTPPAHLREFLGRTKVASSGDVIITPGLPRGENTPTEIMVTFTPLEPIKKFSND